ncbi:MAG: T9SS type A sorting domain-containing protein [Flavobacteriales bacterium]|nr:T9SS type A sorting domain-containing protein [Flavobacteriales bacterium]
MKKITLLLIGTLAISSLNAQTHELWGMTKLGGVNGNGTIFKIDVDGNNQSVEHNFLSTGSDQGIKPTSKLMQASNGKLYGLTPEGGALYQGVLFEYNLVTSTYTMKYDFYGNGGQGDLPFGSLIEASNGKLYGTTTTGGNFPVHGVLFEYDITTNGYTVKVNFDGTMLGSQPFCTLVQANNGKLYGTTYSGGANNDGVIFEYDLVLDTLINKFDFNNSISGRQPWEGLTLASNGKLYGLTRFGGANADGVLYEYDPITNIYTKKIDLHEFTKGSLPQGRLVEASNGKLYGLNEQGGGINGEGVLFEYDIPTGAYTKKIVFDGASKGKAPYGDLVESSNGKLYGMTYIGGTNNIGVLFEYEPFTNTYTKKLDFDGTTTGSYPRGSLIDVINGGSTGIDKKNTLNQINISPNPTTGQINLESNDKIESVEIYNLLGKQVFSKTVNTNETQINLEHLPKGMYVVIVIFDESNLSKKLILE